MCMRSALVFTVTTAAGVVVAPTDVLSPGETYTISVRERIKPPVLSRASCPPAVGLPAPAGTLRAGALPHKWCSLAGRVGHPHARPADGQHRQVQ